MVLNYSLESIGTFKNLNCSFVHELLLGLLEKIAYNVRYVLAMIPNFSVLCSLNTYKGRIINPGNLSEYLRLARPRLPRDKNIAGSHRFAQVFVFNLSHSILVPYGLRNNLFCFLLRDDKVIQC